MRSAEVRSSHVSSYVPQLLRKYDDIDIDDADALGCTCLHHAARWGHYDLAKYLVKRKANVDKTERENGDTPLHISLTFHHPGVTDVLV